VISEFHLALGQFLNYRLALQIKEPDRIIYLAVPLDTFKGCKPEKTLLNRVSSQITRNQPGLMLFSVIIQVTKP
jgi:hypothetical protein